MEFPRFVYRAFHKDSAGINSGDGFRSLLQGGWAMEDEDPSNIYISIQQHFDRVLNPSPWISTTNDLLRAIKIAADWLNDGKDDITIAVIDVEACENCEFYSGDYLALSYTNENSAVHKTEFLFRWEIPGQAIVACVPLLTLVGRGLWVLVPEVNRGKYWDKWETLETWRKEIRKASSHEGSGVEFLQDVGRRAAEVALLFGRGDYTEYIGKEVALWWDERRDIVLQELEKTLYPEAFRPNGFDAR